MNYIDEFYKLNCSRDVLAVTGDLGKKTGKEITEAMAIKRQIKKILFVRGKRQIQRGCGVVDLCTGKALIPVLTAHLFPMLTISIGVDIREPLLDFNTGIKKFIYFKKDIYSDLVFDNYIRYNYNDYILTCCHGCGDLSTRVIDIFCRYNKFKHLVLMPCCRGNQDRHLPAFIKKKIGSYIDWCYYLYERIRVVTLDVKMIQDSNCLSPCNVLIVANK